MMLLFHIFILSVAASVEVYSVEANHPYFILQHIGPLDTLQTLFFPLSAQVCYIDLPLPMMELHLNKFVKS